MLVSHDERLIRLVCKELWVCEGGKVRRIDGGFDEYRDILYEQFKKEGYLWGPAHSLPTLPTTVINPAPSMITPVIAANRPSEQDWGRFFSELSHLLLQEMICCELIGGFCSPDEVTVNSGGGVMNDLGFIWKSNSRLSPVYHHLKPYLFCIINLPMLKVLSVLKDLNIEQTLYLHSEAK